MPILDVNDIRLDPGPLALAINRGRKDSRLEECVADCLKSAASLIRPRALYDYWAVAEVQESRAVVRTADGHEVGLNVGPRADLLSPAALVQIGVVTIGPGLEREVQRLNQTGDIYTGYILDCVGVTFLAEVGKALDRTAEDAAALRGWCVGNRLAPGSLVGWEMTDQPVLAGLLPLEQIGVSINTSGVLFPYKSATSLIGLGPGYTARRAGRVCHLCPRAKDCWRRES